ncbi:response regulator [Candidatus Pelagibacter sp.]|jgi:two-component system phosphate regulon response regulator OmpR|nr:response regulator [Candidatus Pelagibacter sp.]|tara:strand:- start:456 stop:1133 length:678 start_codon:yes stop_codon:yes gene_type:complete
MKKYKAHILVVDDDDRIRELLKEYLTEENYLISTSNNAENAKQKIEMIKFDIIILDIMMPGQSGLDLTHSLREKINTPIILLTAMGEPNERIEGLEKGADDYLAKPFEPKELVLRIKNILKKTESKIQVNEIEFNEININLKKLVITKKNNSHKINNTEKIILEKMINSPGQTFSREQIGKLIKIDKERSIDVIITRLRKKIEDDPKNPKYLQTIRGAGYVLWME